MQQIGLTGSIGSGKSTVARLLREAGIPVLDADVYAREGAVVLQAEICAAFPEVCQGGQIDRQALGRRVFGDDAARKQLETIVHPYVRQRFAEELEKLALENQPLVILEIPLLFESGWEKRLEGVRTAHSDHVANLEGVLVVATPTPERIQRAMQRSGLSRQEVTARDAAQMPQDQKVQRATWVIWNDGDLETLKSRVDSWLRQLQP